MILLDANILLYSANPSAPEHQPVRQWLEGAFGGPEWIGLPWIVIWAFLRIATNPRLFPDPLTVEEGFSYVSGFLSQPRVNLVEPGDSHFAVLESFAKRHRISGPRLTDAVLASMAIEQGATLATTDRGFLQFDELNVINPAMTA